MTKLNYRTDQIDSPIGPLSYASSEKTLLWLEFGDISKGQFPHYQKRYLGDYNEILESKIPDIVKEQLRQYFAGQLKEFTIPLDYFGTDFQHAVWKALLTIPYGETRSYGELAKVLNNPGAMRAVGTANGKNPIPILIPCHRIIQANGTLGGFSGGLHNKRKLLQIENIKVCE